MTPAEARKGLEDLERLYQLWWSVAQQRAYARLRRLRRLLLKYAEKGKR